MNDYHVAEYTAEEECDFILVITEEIVLCIVPNSKRAKELCIRWGMPEQCIGIEAPDDPFDFFSSVPSDWVAVSRPVKTGAHILFQAPLPQQFVVLH